MSTVTANLCYAYVHSKDRDQQEYVSRLISIFAACRLDSTISLYYMSCVVRKPAFCICKNKDADQLRGNCEADQRLCFRFTDSTIPLLPKSKFQASSQLLCLYSPVCVGPGHKSRKLVFSRRGSYNLNSNL